MNLLPNIENLPQAHRRSGPRVMPPELTPISPRLGLMHVTLKPGSQSTVPTTRLSKAAAQIKGSRPSSTENDPGMSK
jgi:hypothetical protein